MITVTDNYALRMCEVNRMSRKPTKITLTCETCVWNDDGLCDRLGYFVDPDDRCSEWEKIKENQSKQEKTKESGRY